MKYQLETIPVWDAFKEGGECPLCVMAAKLESGYLEAALGASVMEPDTRVRVNAEGFCERHFGRMLEMRNRLGLALITHTHLLETSDKLSAALDELDKQLERDEKKNALARAAGGVTKTAPYLAAAKACAHTARGRTATCFVCGQIGNTMARYAETVCYLHSSDREFPGVLEGCKGFCVPHFALLTEAAARMGNSAPFLKAVSRVQRANMKRIADELEWFTLKFDYRNQDKPWGHSKDAPERAIGMLTGRAAVKNTE